METIVKNWSVLGKGYQNSQDGETFLPAYVYITKLFTGTEKEFNEFCNSLYDTIECWKEIKSGEVKEKVIAKKEVVYYNKPIKEKKKFTWEDCFKKEKPTHDKWGMKLK